MVLGIGIDIVEIDSVACSLDRWGRRWADRIFTEEERKYCESRRNPAPCYAARFAAKEAVYKALPRQTPVFMPKHIEVISSPSGKPRIVLHGEAAELLTNSQHATISVSLSHTSKTAAAMVVIEDNSC